MRAHAVSGATSYNTLCAAARMEEQRFAELKKRRQYQNPPKFQNPSDSPGNKEPLPDIITTAGKRRDGKST